MSIEMKIPVKSLSILLVLSVMLMQVGCSSDHEVGQSETKQANSSARNQNPNEEARDAGLLDELLNRWSDEFEQMSSVLDLTEEEQADIKKTYNEQAARIEEFLNTSGKALRDVSGKLKTAFKERSLSKARAALSKDAQSLKQQLTALIENGDQAVLNKLSDERQVEWQSYKLVERFLKLADSIEFSEDQMAQIKQLGRQAAEKSREKANPSAAGFLELQELIEQQVLEPAQRQVFKTIKRKNPFSSLFK